LLANGERRLKREKKEREETSRSSRSWVKKTITERRGSYLQGVWRFLERWPWERRAAR